MKNKVRLNVSADEVLVNYIKDQTDIGSNQELLNNALALMAWAIKEKSAGHLIGSIDDTKPDMSYKEIVMPALEQINITS